LFVDRIGFRHSEQNGRLDLIDNASIPRGGKKGLGFSPWHRIIAEGFEEAGTRTRVPLEYKNRQETPMTFRALGFAGIAVAMTAIPSIAHHSFAMFDAEKTKVLEGTVKEFQWTNPHSWILMTVNNDKDQAEQWAIEMGGPAGLARQGWVPKTLTPGMKVKTVIHPLRDGNNGGQFMAVTLPDGTMMGNPNAAPSANAGAGPGNQ
jgi:hypothetical protein